jgi:hypothetical protein
MRRHRGKSMLADELVAERALSDTLSDYAGRWVAVIDHVVVKDAKTWDELIDRLDESQRERAETFHVSEHPGALHLY